MDWQKPYEDERAQHLKCVHNKKEANSLNLTWVGKHIEKTNDKDGQNVMSIRKKVVKIQINISIKMKCLLYNFSLG